MSHLPPVESASEILSRAIVTVPESDEVLEGEIIETDPEAPLEQSVLNLVTKPARYSQQQSEAIANWLLLQEDATFGTDYLSPLKNSLAVFLTPCRLGAMGVLLLANFLLAWNQLSAPKPVVNLQAETAKFVNPVAQPQTREIPQNLNLAAEKSELAFSSLSTATPAPQPVVSATASLAAPLGTTATPSSQPVVSATASPAATQTSPLGTTPNPSLSNALLPYSPTQQVKPLQSYPAPVKAAPRPTAPALPSVQQPPTAQDIAKQSIIRQDLDRLRLESENPPPLGFNQEYRIKIQSHQTQTNPNQLRQQLQQLQQQATQTKLE